MYKIVFFLFSPLFLFSVELKIASYNVENLFDMHLDGTEYERYIPNQDNWTALMLTQKLTNISEVICDIDADIIGLQEIENTNALRLLQKSLQKYGCFYPYAKISKKSNSAIQVALLSKILIRASQDIVVSPLWGIRNILEVQLMVDSNPLYIYVNHWSSKRSPESKRILSALALKKRVLELPKESQYILLGDFNSDYNEYVKMKAKHNDTHGKTGINHVLKSIQKERLLRVSDIEPNTYQHYNLWLEYAIYQRWSYNFYGKKEGLDAFLLPYTLFDGKGIDYINGSFLVLKKSYLFHKKGYIYRWVYKKKRHIGEGYSDHLPVFAKFSTEAYSGSTGDIKYGTISTLYQKSIYLPLLLRRVKVILKEKKRVIIKDKFQTIVIYGLNQPLELEKQYDILVFKRKLYKGVYEIVDFRVEKRYDGTKK